MTNLNVFDAGDKPHSCELCHKKFALACNLRAHMKTHESEYTYSYFVFFLVEKLTFERSKMNYHFFDDDIIAGE